MNKALMSYPTSALDSFVTIVSLRNLRNFFDEELKK